MNRLFQLLLILSSVAALGSTALAQSTIPRTISYQGKITLVDGGTPIPDGTHQLRLILYDAPNGGNQIFNETQSVPVIDGLFNAIIGSTSPAGIPAGVAFERTYWLGVSVDGGAEMTPRTALTAAPYSLNAAHAERADSAARAATAKSIDGGVVTSINNQQGSITLAAGAGTRITASGSTLTIGLRDSAAGIRFLQQSGNAFTIINPGGPVTTIALARGGIATEQLADGSVTDAKIGGGINYSKLTGTPETLPPSGPAGGHLTGTYPNPTLAPNTVTSDKISDLTISTADIGDSMITRAKIASGVTLPPSGPAGGDLTGTYPNPGVAALRGRTISTTAPADGQLMKWNAATSQWTPAIDDNVPVGFMILGSTQSPPSGYSYAGLSLPQAEVWVTKSSTGFSGRRGLGAAVVNGKIYALGGRVAGSIVNTNEEYDPVTNTWATRSSTGFTAREELAAVAINNKIYAIGGNTTAGAVNTNQEYDPVTNTWAAKSSTGFTARYGLAAAAVNNKIYAIGGLSAGTTLSTNEEYDPVTNTWATKNSTGFTARYYPAAAVINNKVYVVGGQSGGISLNTNEEYDPAANTWATKSSTGFTPRWGLAAAAVNGKLYALGGQAAGTIYNLNEEYDPATNVWATRSSTGFSARFGLTAAAINFRIYALGGGGTGGGGGAGSANRNEEYTPPIVLHVHIKQ